MRSAVSVVQIGLRFAVIQSPCNVTWTDSVWINNIAPSPVDTLAMLHSFHRVKILTIGQDEWLDLTASIEGFILYVCV